jgi:protoporphyrinogen oxidase
MEKIVILGAGLAGFGAANRFHEKGIHSVIYEKNEYIGGHAASFESKGFIFDDGPHISFTKNRRIQKLLAESVNHQFETIQAVANNHWRAYWIKHPAQCNLHGLPVEKVVDILHDFIMIPPDRAGSVKNYQDWLYASFGKTFAETFPMQYGLKFHTTTADNMTTDWIDVRLYRVDLREILYGALTPDTPDVHYVDNFRYPSQGGFAAYLNAFLNKADVKVNHELLAIDLSAKKLFFKNGEETSFDFLISSIPLPELVTMIRSVPESVLAASKKLSCTTCVLVNIGVDRNDLSNAHWTYFYDQDYVFTRLSFPHMQSLDNVPEGNGSVQAEIYYSDKYRPLDRDPESFVDPVIEDLKRCGVLRAGDVITYREARRIPYANVIFDLDRPKALSCVHAFLDDSDIAYCGRYGEWGYHWTDQSFISGEKAAQKVIDLL